MFKNLRLSCVVESGNQRPITFDPNGDTDWHQEITPEIGPNPKLSPTQHRAIEMDYGIVDGTAHIPVRRALQINALHRLGLDTKFPARRPRDQKIVPLNKGQSDRTDLTLPSREGTPSAVAYD